LTVTLCKEAYDDFKRYLRDKEANSQRYKKLLSNSDTISIPSSDIKVGDFIIVEKDQRVCFFLSSCFKKITIFLWEMLHEKK
jgi:phospholipid-translocating ATPase